MSVCIVMYRNNYILAIVIYPGLYVVGWVSGQNLLQVRKCYPATCGMTPENTAGKNRE